MERELPRSDDGSSITAAGVFGLLWRVAVVGVTYALVQTAAGLLIRAWGLDLPAIAIQINPTEAMIGSVLSGVLLALILAPFARRVSIPLVERIAVLFTTIVVLNQLLSVIEGYFFTTYFTRGLPSTLVNSALLALGLAVMIAVLFLPRQVETNLGAALRQWRDQRSDFSWIWRIGLAGVLYLPTYFFFGLLAIPFVQRYYEDPSLGMGLRVPGVETILLLEIARGLMFVLALVPLVALLRGSRWLVGLWLGLIIAALGGWEPLLLKFMWPPIMRLAHGLEITGDSLVQGLTIAWLVGYPRVHRSMKADVTSS
jgi:hypothetical protein